MNIKKGDIFQWRYKDEKLHADYLNYWCCTRIAIANDTHLVDTYWGNNGGGVRGVATFEGAEKLWNLKFMANMDDLERINDWEYVYYRPEDIVNLNHANRSSGAMYRRKGTSRNREVMLEYARQCLEKYESAVDSAMRSVKEYKIKVSDIDGGVVDLNNVYLHPPR